MWKKRLAEETMANYFIENEILEPKKMMSNDEKLES